MYITETVPNFMSIGTVNSEVGLTIPKKSSLKDFYRHTRKREY
jgi:hypothetical protein